MAWAGNRLWVARGNQVFASDYGNPTKFIEAQYLAEGRAFYMPENVTGMVQPNSNAPLIIFGESTNTRIRADILDRTQWLSTSDFQITDHNIGCAAGKSIVKSFGLTWWYSQAGLTNLNNALQLNNDSTYTYLDNTMAASKANMSPEYNGICAANIENYLLMSVPSGDRRNRHTWCMDQLTIPGGGSSWNSIWTGIRPVEFASGKVNGQERIFCLSEDYDGVNRVWELMSPDRDDNGHPILCSVEFKKHNNGDKNLKRFRYTEYFLDEINGTVDLAGFYSSNRGAYKRILNKRIEATSGMFEVKPTVQLDTSMKEYRPQSRMIRTTEPFQNQEDIDGDGIESKLPNFVDTAFSNLLVWSGDMGIKGYRTFIDIDNGDDDFRGRVEEDEVGPKIVASDGAGAITHDDLDTSFPFFEDSTTVTLECPDEPDSDISIGVGVGQSIISEKNATKIAESQAFEDAYKFLECDAEEI